MLAKNNLPKLEIYFYTVSWIFGIIYSVYHVYMIGNEFRHLFEQDLGSGWPFLHRKKDNYDYEWRIWVNFILYTLSPWILVHCTGARIVHNIDRKILPLWYFTVTSICLVYNYGFILFLAFFVQPILFCVLISYWKSRVSVWLFCYILSVVFTQDCVYTVIYYSVNVEQLQLLAPTLMWIYLRCISFSHELLEKRISLIEFSNILGYVFYLPCFFLGPVLLYNEFSLKLSGNSEKPYASWTWLFLQNLRYLLWLFMTEFWLHFIYINCLLPYIDLVLHVKDENVWIMYGIGFSMGQFFFLKYTVVYGLATSWAKAEGFRTPDAPRCIARIYLYSEMWRYFDHGLYLFIKRYIYDPFVESRVSKSMLKRIGISFLCFVFVFIWHGTYYSVFMWSALNFCGVVIETLGREISKTDCYRFCRKKIGLRNERRFLGCICAPLTIVSAISNFYFLGGRKVAETYFYYFYKRGTFCNLICLWFFVYCLCQVSMELNNKNKYTRKGKLICDI